MTKRPNLILCLCDQLRAFEVGCYGNNVVRTPHLDRLASEGVRFETAVTNFPVCMAARSVLLSGQYNRTCTGGVSNIAFPTAPGRFNLPEYPFAGRPHLKQPTLPERLREHGYHNTAIGKWHIHSWPHDIGFDDYLIPRVHHCHTGQSYTENGQSEFTPEGYSLDFEALRVKQFLQGRVTEADPFFLYYNLSPPHCPVADLPEAYRTLYNPDEIPIRPNVDLSRPLANQEYAFKVYRWDFRFYDHHLPFTEHLPEGYGLRNLIAEYYGMTTWMDAAVGRLLNALSETGLADNTIVVFASDHGDNLGSHGLVQKGTTNQESIRIPLMIRYPGVVPMKQVVTDRVASLVDIAPTLLDMAGIPIPSHFHGRPLLSEPQDKSDPLDASSAYVETSGGVAIRTPDFLYQIQYAPNSNILSAQPARCFDLSSDPYEQNNLVEADALPAVAEDLDHLLRNWDRTIPCMETASG